MKFARYVYQAAASDGVLGEGDRLHPLPPGANIDDLIRAGGRAALLAAGEAALAPAAPGLAVDDVRLLPPLRPASIRDSVSFEAHIEGVRKSQEGAHDPVPAQWYDAPCFYFTNPHAGIGVFDDVERFPGSQQFDLELEVGVVYGEHGRNLTPEQAAAGIVGYTIFNDWSARDIQRTEGQLRVHLRGTDQLRLPGRERHPRRPAGLGHVPPRLPRRSLGPRGGAGTEAAGPRRRGHPGGRGHRPGQQQGRRPRPGPGDPEGQARTAEGPAPLAHQ